MNDRIKLAEAMGWGIGVDTCNGQEIGVPPGDKRPYGQGNLTDMPDPFTDANDDYAVLEWMRNAIDSSFYRDQQIQEFYDALPVCCDYRIGDYACSALRVLQMYVPVSKRQSELGDAVEAGIDAALDADGDRQNDQ